MNRHSLLTFAVLTALGAFAVAGVADAQQPPPKKLYRWVDKDGKVQFSDSLPPEAIDQARTELSNSGRVVADVGRALTPEEQAAADAAAALEAERAAEAERVRKTEEAMVASFESEEDLRKSVQERISLLQETLNSIEAGIASQRASLSALLNQASEIELAGGTVAAKQSGTIRQLHVEIGRQQQMLIVRKSELDEVGNEMEYLLRRFREIKAGPDAATAPGAAPAEGTSPEAAPAGAAPDGSAPPAPAETAPAAPASGDATSTG